MAEEAAQGIDEWDENFLDEIIRIELQAVSSRPSNPSASAVSGPTPDPFAAFDAAPLAAAARPDALRDALGFSPPRELSQWFAGPSHPPTNSTAAPDDDECEIIGSWVPRPSHQIAAATAGHPGLQKEKEVERLRRELSQASKQLSHLEHECTELKREKKKKDEQLKCAFQQIEDKESQIQKLKNIAGGNSVANGRHDLNMLDTSNCSKKQVAGSNKDFFHKSQRGSATDGNCELLELKQRMVDNSTTTSGIRLLKEQPHQSNKSAEPRALSSVGIQTDQCWDSHDFQWKKLGSSRLSAELRAVWGIPGSSGIRRNPIMEMLICSEDLLALFRCVELPENVKASTDGISSNKALINAIFQLQETVSKIQNQATGNHTLIEALLHLLANDNVHVIARKNASIKSRVRSSIDARDDRGTSCSLAEMPDLESFLSRRDEFDRDQHHSLPPFSFWRHLFTTMGQIAAKHSEENICDDAISIMIILVLQTDLNTERWQFGMAQVLTTVHQLLQKKTCLVANIKCIYLLFCILNRPDMLKLFCDGGRDNTCRTEPVQDESDASQLAIDLILEDLSQWLTCGTASVLELKLHRQVILILAYIASHGQSGYEILLRPSRPDGVNFLQLIILLLVSVKGAEISSVKAESLVKERNLLVREALILLNRLVSHPAYLKMTLESLTSKQCAPSTIDVTNGFSVNSRGPVKPGDSKKLQIEAEIADLVRVFRTRVYAFLGEHYR